MRSFRFKRNVAVGTGVLVALLVTFAAVSNQQRAGAERKRQVLAVGADWQQAGWLSQADYVRVTAVKDSVVSSRRLSDADLDWLLQEHQRGANPVVRAKVLGILSTLVKPPQSQAARIAPAVARSLASSDEMERGYASRVQRKLGVPD